METNDKLTTLLRLMDEPEAMTEAQLQELLADEEVREAYELMAACKKVYQREVDCPPLFTRQFLSFRKAAAIILAAAFLGGLAWAISPFLTSHKGESQSPEVSCNPLPPGVGQERASSLIRFSDVRLDSILTIVSAHYGKAVCFRDSATRQLRLSTMWDSEDSLAVLIATLNEFDGLRLTDEGDTVFVEYVAGEEE
ncbi:MAG: DUF4974 domain-containing protein [Bacteroidaceae bacterium]|nr:DUF4974 domain-containing protein [Bacteroidaceae bacterium]